MKELLALCVLPLLVSASPVQVETIHNDAAPILLSSNAKELPNSYIVVFKKHVTDDAAAAHHSWVQDLHLERQNTRTELRKRDQFPFSDTIFEGFKHTYNIAGAFLGYSGHFDDETIEQVRRHPDVSISTLSPTPSAELN
jgi:cerevisin